VLVRKAGMVISLSKWLPSFDTQHQCLSPDGTETLLDRHLVAFDGWLRAHLMSLSASPQIHHYLTVVTLLDQLDLKEYNWQLLPVILPDPFVFVSGKLLNLIDGTRTNIEFSQLLSKFLMDRKRARFFWIYSQTYADLAKHILEFVCDNLK